MNAFKLALASVALLVPTAALADFPSGKVTLIVPFTAGGGTDAYARYLAEGLSKVWNVPVVVENRAGAGSMIGTAAVAKAKPDGHTLLLTTPSITTAAAINENLPFDPHTEIASVAMLALGHYVLTSGPKNDAATIEQLQAQGSVFYGAVGNGSTTHMVAAQLMSLLGLKAEPVFYKGGTDAVVDLIGGRIDLYVPTISQAAGNVQEKQIRGIAVTSAERSKTLPDVPTLKELGIDAEISQWWALFTTGGTPAETIAQLNADVNAVLSRPETAEYFATLGATPVVDTASFMHDTYEADIVKWRAVAAEHNIKPE